MQNNLYKLAWFFTPIIFLAFYFWKGEFCFMLSCSGEKVVGISWALGATLIYSTCLFLFKKFTVNPIRAGAHKRTRVEKRQEKRLLEKKGRGREQISWDSVAILSLVVIPLALLYALWVNSVDDYTYDPYDAATYDEFLPNDGTSKGLIVTQTEVPTTTAQKNQAVPQKSLKILKDKFDIIRTPSR